MDFPQPLLRGRLIQRYKRFLADVVLDNGDLLTAHCPNPGAMLGLNMPGLTCWLSHSPDAKRKLAYTLELVEIEGSLVGINTMLPNRIVAEALAEGAVPELAGYRSIRREVKYGSASRVDFLLQDRVLAPASNEGPGLSSAVSPRGRLWLEVKNCHLSRAEGLAEFPDCVAARSTKHLRELEAMVHAGDRAAVLFVVQREDCGRFQAAEDCDPDFARALVKACDSGVELYAYACNVSLAGIRLSKRIAA